MKKIQWYVEYPISLTKSERTYFDDENSANEFYDLKRQEFNCITGFVRKGYVYTR